MIAYHCDGCGKKLAKHELRYTVEIQVKAAYDKLEIGLTELVRDHRAELIALIERLKSKDPKELEESIYKRIKLDLCPDCQRAFLPSPLRFHPEQSPPPSEVDIDAFLRSLGIGASSDGEGE
jgi:hypothetical protein